MKFTCAKADLSTAIGIVARAASKMQKSILECIYFNCEDGKITLKATDIAISIKTEVIADIEEEGVMAVPARLLNEVVNRFPDGDISFYCQDDNSVNISCMNSDAKIQLMNSDEFPEFPEVEKNETVKIAQNTLRRMISQTLFAAATTEEKPILTGLLFDIDGASLTVVGLDGYRMSVRGETVISDIKRSCVIPARTLREVSRIVDDTDDTVKMAISDTMALFETEDTQIYTRLLEGQFVNYRNLIPKECTTNMKVEVELLLDSVARASIMATDVNNKITFTISEKELTVVSNSEMGEIKDVIPVLTEGEDLKIAFNAKYVHDILASVDDDVISMRFGTKLSPCVVKKDGEHSYEYLILPVQIRE